MHRAFWLVVLHHRMVAKSKVKNKPAAKPKAATKAKAKQKAATKAKAKPKAKAKTKLKPKTTAKVVAKAKPSAKPKAEPPSRPQLRGVALVDAAMAARTDGPFVGRSAQLLDADRLGDHPLTPVLRRWLERDDAMFTLGPATSFSELVAAEFGEEWVEAFAPLLPILTAPCVLFEGWGSDSRRFLYLGTPDEHGDS